jgi:hypothetical protein
VERALNRGVKSVAFNTVSSERVEEIEMKGQCLCGAIRVEIPDNKEVGACHCDMCRKWTSGPYMAVSAGSDALFTGEEPVRYTSSRWADRGFCGRCGTHLFYYLKPNDEFIVSVGLFTDQEFDFTHQIFVEEKPAFYQFSNHTHMMTGEEVIAASQSNIKSDA